VAVLLQLVRDGHAQRVRRRRLAALELVHLLDVRPVGLGLCHADLGLDDLGLGHGARVMVHVAALELELVVLLGARHPVLLGVLGLADGGEVVVPDRARLLAAAVGAQGQTRHVDHVG
jgi:putative component of toxin-antitoxin plasmid stabilization module